MSERPESEQPEPDPESGDGQEAQNSPADSSADGAGAADAPKLPEASSFGEDRNVDLEPIPARPPTRREIIKQKTEQSRRNKPYILAGILIVLGLAAIPAYAFVNEFVLPPRKLAVRVEDKIYSRGDLVDFIRFHQRLSEDAGQAFSIGSSLFDALGVISENEMAFQGAPRLGVTVTDSDIDQKVRRLLGFGYATEENLTSELETQIDESLFTFLNNVSLSEDTYRDIIRKDLFRNKVRDRLAEDVPRIQEQVHVFRIVFGALDEGIRNRIDQRIKAGENISDLVAEYSVDQDVRRNGGDQGWLPRGVTPELDILFFGVDDDGNRFLPIGQVSEILQIPGENAVGVLYLAEYAAARPVDTAPFEILKDRALQVWFQEVRKQVEVVMIINSEMNDWVNRQVRSSTILLTPTPDPADSGQFSIDGLGQLIPAGRQ